jgi:6-carboxyhexanoate--CoA ligase
MRASRTGKRKSEPDFHVSGAEGVYDDDELIRAGTDYIARAVGHPRGMPDTIVLTFEAIKDKPLKAPLLSIGTEECRSPEAAWDIISHKMSALGISGRALNNAHKVLRSDKTMRGASLISAKNGARLEPDPKRGVRVSRLGIGKASKKRLTRKLASMKINTDTVKEALILASKVVSCKYILAEICVSDDPDYTTGYVASMETGYLRLPNIKNRGEMHGGRVFFLKPDADILKTINYLEKEIVILEDKKG